MALVVEDGSIVDGANGYISVADCDAYHSERGNAAWTGDNATKEAAIIRAADYLDYAYSWKGQRISGEQPMMWPRDLWNQNSLTVDFSASEVPPRVVRANAELALLALTGSLMPAQDGGKLTSESVSVGGAITRSRSYAGGGADPTQRRFPFVDRMLSELATGGSAGVRGVPVERA